MLHLLKALVCLSSATWKLPISQPASQPWPAFAAKHAEVMCATAPPLLSSSTATADSLETTLKQMELNAENHSEPRLRLRCRRVHAVNFQAAKTFKKM